MGTHWNRLAEAVLTSTTIYVLSRNKKNNVYPCKPQFYYIKVGFKGVKIIYVYFRDVDTSGSSAYVFIALKGQSC